MNDAQQLSLNISKTIQAPVEEVFEAWLNPDTLSRFMLPKPGMPSPAVSLDPKVGGRFKIDMDVGEKIVPHEGEYTEIDRPRRLSFTWNSPFSAPGSIVTIEFKSIDNSTTEVRLNHVRFLSEESCANHRDGWTNILIQQTTIV